jgi:hypothetical protein
MGSLINGRMKSELTFREREMNFEDTDCIELTHNSDETSEMNANRQTAHQ